ncbi:unnamed protein product, partial [Rotaria sordida]
MIGMAYTLNSFSCDLINNPFEINDRDEIEFITDMLDDVIRDDDNMKDDFIETINPNVLIDALGVKSYGTIIFDHNQSNRANFIRIPSDASTLYVKQLLIRRCQNKRPSLVISVTGSTREYSMKSKLFRMFRQGLLKVAKTTDIWIITGGVNTSITKLIGEIIRTNPDPSHPIHLIGIAPWGCISGVEQLDVHGTNVIYVKSKTGQNNEISLEPNHTQFILIDDGTTHQYGGEIEFRIRLEKAFSGESFILQNKQQNSSDINQNDNKSISSYSQSDNIPVVLLVIDGELETIKKVHESVIKNKIPVVLLEGTGGCCDLFAKCYHLYNEYHSKSRTSVETNVDQSYLLERNEQIKNKLRERLQTINDKINIYPLDIDKEMNYFELIYECIEKQMILLNFIDFKVHSHVERDIDLAILQALLNAPNSTEINVEQKLEQLNLALEWNRVDIVKSLIMKENRDWIKINLNDLFFKVVIRNQRSFVQLFLNHDFSLNDLFKNTDQLRKLYGNENYILRHNFNDSLQSIYKDIIQPLIETFFEVDAVFYSDGISYNHDRHTDNNTQSEVHSHVERDIDLAILQALLNAPNSTEINVEQKLEQLNLALEWNRVDIVKSLIMKEDRDWIKINLNDLFFKALVRNQTSFVQLFLDHDFTLNDLFKNTDQLWKLYENENYILRHNFNDPLQSIYKDIIQPLIGTFFEVDAVFDSDGISYNHDQHIDNNIQSEATTCFHANQMDIDKELFLWSVLTSKHELALLFWARGKNKICAALIAMLLNKRKAQKEKHLRYNEWADQFENLAVEILEKFYRIHPSQCAKAIIREIPQFGNVTWLHLAVMAEAKLFIAQRAVQNVLNSIWYGYIDRRVGNTKIIFSTIMLWYSGFLPYHKELVEINDNIHFTKVNDRQSFIRHDAPPQSQYMTDKSIDMAQCKLMEDEQETLDSDVDNTSLIKKSGLKQYWENITKFINAPYVKYLYNL